MKSLPQRSFARPTWLDRSQSQTRDALVLLGIGLAVFAVAHFYDLPPLLLQFGLDHADWEVDDAIFVVFMLSVALMIYGYRRYKDLSREIAGRIVAEGEAPKLARHDPLTGLPNRRFFEERLQEYLGAGGPQKLLAVMMLDLDGFKVVNDTHGHAVGDKALSEFARRASVILRADAFLARIGGDEFAIIMPVVGTPADAASLARRVIAAVIEPLVMDTAIVQFGVGVGIAVSPNDGDQADDLMRRADRALYRAKSTGRSTVRFFEAEWTPSSSVER